MRQPMSSHRPETSRPTTSGGPTLYNEYYDDVDDDDESDDGDVFAFLPPSTPEQHQFSHQHGSQPGANSLSPLSQQAPLTSPAPTYPFDPYARFPGEAPGMAGQYAVHQAISQPLTPPSTGSHSHDQSAILMNRLQRTTPQSSIEVRVSLPSEKDPEAGSQSRRLHTKSDSRASTSMGGSFVAESDEGREASIKYVAK